MMSDGILIGIDVGGTNCRGARVSPDGQAGPLCRIETLGAQGLEKFLARLENFIREHLPAAEGPPVVGVGVGIPGIVTSLGVVLESPNLRFLDGLPLEQILTDRLALPVKVTNDVNAIGWGEARRGAGRSMGSFVAVALGTGVGGCLVLERSLWTGVDGAAGEIGHVMVEELGRPCGCGSRGCLEQYASASGIVKSMLESRSQGMKSRLDTVPAHLLTSDAVATAARSGDEMALHAFALAGAKLGQVLAGTANLLNIEGILITGGASGSLDLMRPSLDEELRRRCFSISAKSLRICRGELGDRAGVIGAALLALPS